jgi:hypothetical protein
VYSSMPRITRGNIGVKTNEELIAALTEYEIKRNPRLFIERELRRRFSNREPILKDSDVCQWSHGWLTYEQWLELTKNNRHLRTSITYEMMKEKHPQYFLTT